MTTAKLHDSAIIAQSIHAQDERNARFVAHARKAEYEKLRERNPQSRALLRFPEFHGK